MNNVYARLQELLKQFGEGQILVTSLGDDIQGNICDFRRSFEQGKYLSAEEHSDVLLSGSPMCIQKEGKLLLAEPFYSKERIVIFGGGHIALPLVKMAKIVGFYVIVIDDRMQFAYQERFPEADEVHCGSFSDCIKKIQPAKSDYNVIITRGHKHDGVCIRELMKYEEAVYTGLIGSRRRTGIVMNNLVEEGYDRDRLMSICTPIGLPIGAVTMEEIGISIIAEIIQRKRLQSRNNIAVNRSDGDDKVLQRLSTQQKPCCVITIMKTMGSVPRKAGAKMIVYEDTSIYGSIGGGCVEAEVIRKGVKMIGSGKYEIMSVNLDNEDAMAEGMVCGGKLQLLLEDFC